jgi:predicted Fe-Mo cluster-binding NifX family protein
MKVIIPVIDNKEARYIISKSFQSSDYFCIYDNALNTYEWIEKKEISAIEGNLCISLIVKGIYNIITCNIEFMTLAMYTEVGHNVSKAVGISVKDNIKMFFNNKLGKYTFRDSLETIDFSNIGSDCILYN